MIKIVPYKATWPTEFQAIGLVLREALGSLALRIDHIGSTSVPDLAAKDRIDIQITVESLVPEIEEKLQQAGYARVVRIICDHVPPGATTDPVEWTKWIFSPADPAHAVNVHVRIQGRANQRYPLLFRDYLRTHPAVAEAYAQVKQGLVAHGCDTSDAYYDVKDPVCDIIMSGAEAWAAHVGWRQVASDI